MNKCDECGKNISFELYESIECPLNGSDVETLFAEDVVKLVAVTRICLTVSTNAHFKLRRFQ